MKEINIKKIKPLHTAILTTMDKYEEDTLTKNGLILDKKKLAGTIKLYQTVIAIGDSVRNLEPGQMVFINPARYYSPDYTEKQDKSLNGVIHMANTPKFNLPVITLDGKEYLYLDCRDVDYIIEDYDYSN